MSKLIDLENEIAFEMHKAREEIGASEQQRIAFAYAEAAMRSVFTRARASLDIDVGEGNRGE